jgi:aryl-alcohol dehydrogenase-like predicted oxidoreductase
MRTRPLGKTGLRVTEMALGTWGLSGDGYGAVEESEQEKVLERALEMGFQLIDTADAYGAGRMERLVGKAVGDRTDVVLVTKGGTDRTTSPARKRFDGPYLRESLERSLRRLGRDYVDVYLLHNPSGDALQGGEAIDMLHALKSEGKIHHWGASVGTVAEGRLALQCQAEVIELAYNLVQGVDVHRLAGEIIVSGAGLLAHSTLAYGLLAGTWAKEREFPAGDHRADRWTKLELARRVEQVAELRFLVHGDVQTMRAAAVRYVLANRIVSSAILGPRSVTQLEELVREVGMGPVYLRDEDLMRVPRALENLGIDP